MPRGEQDTMEAAACAGEDTNHVIQGLGAFSGHSLINNTVWVYGYRNSLFEGKYVVYEGANQVG